MSVITEADEHLDDVKENINDAVKSLSNILVEECWGHDDYTSEYKSILYDTYRSLLDIKRKLQ